MARSVPVGRLNWLAILPYHLQAQFDRLPRVGLCLFQGIAIGHDRGELGLGHREPALRLGTEQQWYPVQHAVTRPVTSP